MRPLSAAIFVLGLCTLFWFFTTKPIQLARETQISPGALTLLPGGLWAAWRDGAVRRLDDASFWNACVR